MLTNNRLDQPRWLINIERHERASSARSGVSMINIPAKMTHPMGPQNRDLPDKHEVFRGRA